MCFQRWHLVELKCKQIIYIMMEIFSWYNCITWPERYHIKQLILFSISQSFSTGTGGGKNVYHDFCLLPKNVITQKFYSFWFMWIVGLVIISTLMLIVRFAIICDKKTRKIILYKWYEGKAETGVSV